MATNATENLAESLSIMKITDLNLDCLEKICMNLSLKDLLNVADANQQLKKGAELVFVLKYSKKTITMMIMNRPDFDSPPFFNGFNTLVYTLKDSLQMMRCFGHLFSKLDTITISKRGSNDVTAYCFKFNHIMNYATEYCANLNELNVCALAEGTFDNLVKAFSNVKSVVIHGHIPAATVLNRLFPSVQYLNIDYGEVATQFDGIEKYFPYLNQIEVITNYNPNTYSLETGRRSPTHIFGEAVLKNTEPFGELRKEDPNLVLNFPRLEKISLCFNFKDDEHFYNFFDKFPFISQLKLTKNEHNRHEILETLMDVSKLRNTLPLLKQIDFRCCKFTSASVIEWMDQFESLEKFDFHIDQHAEIGDELQARFIDHWEGSIRTNQNKFECSFTRTN